jgi:aspartate dehydrogenase
LLGFGAIGRALARGIHEGRAGGAVLAAIAGKPDQRHQIEQASTIYNCSYTANVMELPDLGANVVVEAASQAAVARYAVALLARDVDLVVMSVGAFASDELYHEVTAAATANGRCVYLPSGAIGALDLVQAARLGRLDHVRLTTTKSRAGLSGNDSEADEDGATILFEGNAREAVTLYPRNINVAAALSLAGFGFDATAVTIVVDPDATTNTHRIDVAGEFGTAVVEIANQPDTSNPRTSRLAILSALSLLSRIGSPIRIG